LESDYVEVTLVAQGARIYEKNVQKLYLDFNQNIKFTGTVLPNAEVITLTALYFYKRQVVGQASRHVFLKGDKKGSKRPQVFNPGQIAIGGNIDSVDITVMVNYSIKDNLLSWRVIDATGAVDDSEEIYLDDSRAFAYRLMRDVGYEAYSGRGAWNILESVGQRIGKLLPGALFTALKNNIFSKEKTPRMLLMTDEFYIPWELAFHENLELNSKYPAFLNLQTEIGRWLLSKGVERQPVSMLRFDQFGVVAANYNEMDQRPLLEAQYEKETLIRRYGARSVAAMKNDLTKIADSLPSLEGRILHLALHGYSRPDLNEQSIALEDGNLLAAAWLPARLHDEKPILSFIFLNACQVGTAGSSLSQAGGFPGELFSRGLLGFIAPLWDVHDVHARTFSEGFYDQVLNQKIPVSKAILSLRRNFESGGSLTEMAYIYYGHPRLQFEQVMK